MLPYAKSGEVFKKLPRFRSRSMGAAILTMSTVAPHAAETATSPTVSMLPTWFPIVRHSLASSPSSKSSWSKSSTRVPSSSSKSSMSSISVSDSSSLFRLFTEIMYSNDDFIFLKM